MSAQSRQTASHQAASASPAAGENVIVNVGLDARAYDIVIGRDILDQLGARIASLRPGARTAIVTDEGVAKHWLERARASLAAAGISSFDVIVGEGESSKTYPVLTQVCEALIAGKLERNDLVVALGGGVVGDLTGFAASIVRRGMDFVQVPTSLLAQVDSSVGGKTGINSPHGKNLIGAFHQPRLVIADTAVLDTLSPRQFAAGYAEVAKYGVLGDEKFLAWLEANHTDVFKGGAAREYAIAQSCRAKAAIVARDEREDGERALLNLGHTFGHALEAATGFSDRLFHGEGVSIGMSLAAEFSADLGMISAQDAERVRRHLESVGLPTRLQEIGGFAQEGIGNADSLLALMGQDKKVKRGKLTFILLCALGQAEIVNDVDPVRVKDFLTRKLS
jgi:3-dehydroquinate synthase